MQQVKVFTVYNPKDIETVIQGILDTGAVIQHLKHAFWDDPDTTRTLILTTVIYDKVAT